MASSDDEKNHMKEERDFFTSTPIFFQSFVFYWGRWGWGVCAERNVTQEGSREDT